MKAPIISIGNSKGVRLPKAFLQQCNFTDSVDIEVQGNKIVLAPLRQPREGWEEAAKLAHAREDDVLLIPDSLENIFDREEWEW
ncbi:MAG TPA: hypothetical protein DF383_00250 [Deltaproteobacteria bacterium]|nr:hypothetical protein [Deltaproteobacteria bacterium]